MNDKKEWIVILRAFACMAVIMIHVVAGWTESANIELTGNRFILDEIIIQPFIRWAVPMFVLISGCLLLNPDKDITIKKIINYIKKMLIILITFVFVYCVIENIFTYGLGNLWKLFYLSIFNLIQGKSWAAMWYIYLVVGLYMITPILRHFVKNASKDEIKFVVSNLMIFSILVPTINKILNIEITTFYLNGFEYLTLYLLGYVMANNYFDEKKVYFFGFIGFVGYILCSTYNLLLDDQSSIFIIMVCISIFCYFSNNHYKLKNNKVINIISNDSLGIYLIHTFWLNIFNKGLHLYPSVLPILVGEIVFFVITLLLSIISTEILKRLPIFKKVL